MGGRRQFGVQRCAGAQSGSAPGSTVNPMERDGALHYAHAAGPATTGPATTGPVTAHPLIGGAREMFSDLIDSVDALTDGVVAQIIDGEHAYAASVLPPGVLEQIVHANIESILQCMLGATDSLDAPRTAGRVKAEHGIPLASLLHAYRLAGLHLWEAMMVRASAPEGAAALLSISSQFWGIIDRFSNAAAETYREVVDERERNDQRSKNVMLSALLDGQFTGDVGRAIRVLGLPERSAYVVLAAEMRESAEDPLPALTSRLRSMGVSSAWAPWKGEYLGLLGSDGGIDASSVARILSDSVGTRVGVSLPVVSLDRAPAAVTQALLAMRSIVPGAAGVRCYGAAPIDIMLVAQPSYAAELRDDVLKGLAALDPRDARVLLDTLECWFATDGSTAECGRRMNCHRNTVLHRLGRISVLTGRSVARPSHAAELFAALRAVRLVGSWEEPARAAPTAALM